MDPERWQRIETLFLGARKRAPAERGAFLSDACGGDAELRREVESLLAGGSGEGALDSTLTHLSAGSQLGPYRIEAPIGAGGMGEVFRATDTRLHRTVAIKTLPRSRFDDSDRQRRFLQEARAASALNHPNIVTLYDIAEENGVHYIVMEYVPGKSLDKLISPKGMPLADTLSYVQQIGEALAAAHAAGIVHRDIKPANVIVTAESQVKILDFGLAKLAERGAGADGETATEESALTGTGAVMGTVAYMSPEQAAARPLDHRTDIFSLGLILYEMIAGARPFRGKSQVETMHAIIHDPTPPLPQAPPEIGEIMAKALAKDPKERYQHAGDLALDLRRFQRAWQTKSLPSMRAEGGMAPKRRTGLGALVALLIVALPAAWWLGRGRQSTGRNLLEGATFTRLTDFEGVETDAAISPDGNFVAFISDRDGPLDVWILQLGSGQFLNLTKGKVPFLNTQVRVLGFSADGSHVTLMMGPNPNGPLANGGTSIIPTIGGPARLFLAGGLDPQWSPDGSRMLFFSLVQNKDVMYLADRDGANRREVFPVAPGEHNHFMAWSSDGRHVYSSRATRNVQETDIWRAPATGGQPEQITHHGAWTAYPTQLDERTLLYIATDEYNAGTWLYAMDLETRQEHRLSVGIEQYVSIAASPPTPGRPRRLVATISNPTGSLWSMPIGDSAAPESAAIPFPVPSVGVSEPRFGPDYLLFLSSRALADSLWKLQGETVTELWKASDGAVMAAPAISRDGKQVAITALKQGHARLFVITADGASPQPLAPSLSVREPPTWSPDGKTLAAAGYDDKGPGLFLVPVDGGAPVRIYDKICYIPAWSPDGRYILFAEYVLGAAMQMRAIAPDGKPFPVPEIRLTRTSTKAMSSAFRFLPDGKSIVIQQGEWRKPQFWLVNLETGARLQLTDLRPGRAVRSFDVTRDGKRILFDRVQENSDVVLIDLAK